MNGCLDVLSVVGRGDSFTPVYHVCQECLGDGCRDCGSMGIVEGDYPDELFDRAIPTSDARELDFNVDAGIAQ